MAAPPPMKMLTLDEARTALREALAEFDKPENKSRMETAITECMTLTLCQYLFWNHACLVVP
jgi:hypothetical protein